MTKLTCPICDRIFEGRNKRFAKAALGCHLTRMHKNRNEPVQVRNAEQQTEQPVSTTTNEVTIQQPHEENMNKMVWATDLPLRRFAKTAGAAMTVSLRKAQKNTANRVLLLTLSPDTYKKANITPEHMIDVGVDPNEKRLAIRVHEHGPCRLSQPHSGERRNISLYIRQPWRLKPEAVAPSEPCAVEIIHQGYIQARLPNSWRDLFVPQSTM